MFKNIFQKKDNNLEVKKYEANLKLIYDSIRKDYDNILTSIMPTQENLIKTYLWLNTFILGVCFLFIKEELINGYVLTLLVFSLLLCVISMSFLIYALYYNKPKSIIFLEPKKIKEYKNNEFAYTRGLINLINATKKAFDHNFKIVEFKAVCIRRGGLSLFLAFLCFAIAIATIFISYNYYNLNYRKEVAIMSDKNNDKLDFDEDETITMSLSTNSKIRINTESVNEDKNNGFNITADDKSQSDNNSSKDKDK